MQGVYARETSIQIHFTWDGRRYKETLFSGERECLAPTPGNLKHAARLRLMIKQRIAAGAFTVDTFRELFPYSRSLATLLPPTTAPMTWGKWVETWLDLVKPQIERTTHGEYRNALRWYFAAWQDRRLTDITVASAELHMATLTKISGKTHNNVLAVGRLVLAKAVEHGHLAANPLAHIKPRRHQRPAPDPLTPDEVTAVLDYARRHYPEGVANYWETALFTGLRPSEAIAVTWPNLDTRTRTLRVTAARVRGQDKGTKTHQVRDIELIDQAWAALQRQRAATQLVGDAIFLDPLTGHPWKSTEHLVQHYWRPMLRALGIRDRDARQTRHTFATLALMAGSTPAWAARQLGHSTEMFHRVYSRWIDGADRGRERQRLSDFVPRVSLDVGGKKASD
jgi:integrase